MIRRELIRREIQGFGATVSTDYAANVDDDPVDGVGVCEASAPLVLSVGNGVAGVTREAGRFFAEAR